MKALLITICMVFLVIKVQAQTLKYPIKHENKRYYQNGEMLKSPDLRLILAENIASSNEYKLFKKNNTIATPFAIVGGVCLAAGGFTMLSSSIKESKDIENGELNNTYPSGMGFMLVGLSCCIVTIPFSVSAKKHLNKSVDLYNSSLNAESQKRYEFDLLVNTNGLGVRMRF